MDRSTFLLTALLLLAYNVKATRYPYNGSVFEQENVFGVKKEAKIRTAVVLNARKSFVFGTECQNASSCTTEAHSTYDIEANKNVPNKNFTETIGDLTLSGVEVTDTVEVSGVYSKVVFGVVSEVNCVGSAACNKTVEHDGVLSLSPEENDIIRRITSIVYVQNAENKPSFDASNNIIHNNQVGFVATGEIYGNQIKECGKFEDITTQIPNQHFLFTAKFIIHGQTADLTVKFDPNSYSGLKQKHFSNFFGKQLLSYADATKLVRDVTIDINGTQLVIKAGDYVVKNAPRQRYVLIQPIPDESDVDLVLGFEFLQRHCVGLYYSKSGEHVLAVAPNLVNKPDDGMRFEDDDEDATTTSTTTTTAAEITTTTKSFGVKPSANIFLLSCAVIFSRILSRF